MSKKGRPMKYEEERGCVIYRTSKENRKALKLKCISEDRSMNDVIDTLVKMYLNDEIELEM